MGSAEASKLGSAVKVLLATWDGAGNLPPELALARGLVAAGADVCVLAHDHLEPIITRSGARFAGLASAPQWDGAAPLALAEQLPKLIADVWASHAYAMDFLDVVDREAPDVLLIDITLLATQVAARARPAPRIVLCHSIYAAAAGIERSYPALRSGLADLASRLGVEAPETFSALVASAASTLAFTFAEFDAPAGQPENYRVVGPLRASGTGVVESFSRLQDGRPLILVSLSTSYMDQADLLQRICDALASLPVEAFVTTGEAIDPKSLRLGPNTRAERSVPHDAVLPHAALVVTHAGHGTTMAALAHGVPLLCIPLGRDQPLIARRVEELGVGRNIPATSTLEDIADTIRATLDSSSHRANAQGFARRAAAHPGLTGAVRAVFDVASV